MRDRQIRKYKQKDERQRGSKKRRHNRKTNLEISQEVNDRWGGKKRTYTEEEVRGVTTSGKTKRATEKRKTEQ